jgi:hypothetical protein
MSEVTMGTLYDLNKQVVQAEISLTGEYLEKKKDIIKDFLKNTDGMYYMLLCNERKDYTVFRNEYRHAGDLDAFANVLVDECLLNRGLVKGIDKTKGETAIEIWLSIDGEAYVYYFFKYDDAIIEI